MSTSPGPPTPQPDVDSPAPTEPCVFSRSATPTRPTRACSVESYINSCLEHADDCESQEAVELAHKTLVEKRHELDKAMLVLMFRQYVAGEAARVVK